MAGLVTLTPQQFAAHPASRKPGATYQSYLRFVAKRRGAKLATAAADSLAPTPEPVLRQQTTEAVRAQIDPIIREITGSTDRAAKGVESLTDTYAARLVPFEGAAKERYGRAAEATAGVATALADRLAGRGAEEGASLKQKLAQIGAPDRLTQEVAGGAQAFATGVANAGFGVDSAALDEIIGHGVTAEDFAGSLPGIARIAGVRAVGDVQRQGQKQIGEVRGKIPGLVAELMESARDREVNKGIARLGLQKTKVKTAADQAAAAYESTKPDASLSNTLGYLVDSNGVPILDGSGQPIPTQGNLDDQAAKANDLAEARAAAVKNRTGALTAAKTKARELARELKKGRDTGKTAYGKPVRDAVPTAEATRLILAELAPSLAQYGVKPGTKLWTEVRNAVLDAIIDAGFQVGATNPTKVTPGREGPADKPRG